MKRIVIALALVVAAATSAVAADGRAYMGLAAGLFVGNDSRITDPDRELGKVTYEPGFVVAGTGGYAFKNGIRLEGELAYRRAEIDAEGLGKSRMNGDLWAISVLASAFYDFKTDLGFTPYVGGGFGFSTIDIDSGLPDSDTVFAYQAGAGVGFRLSDNMVLDLAYRYFGSQDLHVEVWEEEFSSHNFMAGIRYYF